MKDKKIDFRVDETKKINAENVMKINNMKNHREIWEFGLSELLKRDKSKYDMIKLKKEIGKANIETREAQDREDKLIARYKALEEMENNLMNSNNPVVRNLVKTCISKIKSGDKYSEWVKKLENATSIPSNELIKRLELSAKKDTSK